MKPHHDLRMLGSGPGILLFGLLVTTPCFGQVTPEAASAERWSWPRLRSVEEVDAGEISWLGKHVTAEEAVRLFSIVDSLSSPDAAQLLAGRFLQDPSYYYLQAIPETFERVEALVLDSLTSRHPEGDAGVVHVAYLLARIRWTIVQAYSRLPYYQYTFEGRQLDLDSPRVPENRITLDLDVSPATRLLEVLASPDATPHTAADYLASDVFAALIQHRSQSFYPVSVSLEVLALNLARAAGDEPLDRLYRYAFPVGLFHFAAVREHLDDYRTVVRTIDQHKAAIVAHIKGAILPYLPDAVTLTRTVHFLFADGADGWYADGIVGVDLEHFADDYEKLLNILVHETYHAAQDVVREPQPDFTDSRLARLAEVLETIFREGTANYVAPTHRRSEDEAMQAAQRGAELLSAYHEALFGADEPDGETLRHLRDEGVRGAGPFYWLGRAMSQTIVKHFGPGALARTLPGGGITFARTYLDAARQAPEREILLNGALAATLMQMQ